MDRNLWTGERIPQAKLVERQTLSRQQELAEIQAKLLAEQQQQLKHLTKHLSVIRSDVRTIGFIVVIGFVIGLLF